MPEAMEPTRNPRATLPELVDVLLNKGVYLDLDLIITVSDIPLIGVNLRATIAGMETMLEYGMMRNWDERTRAWVRQSISRDLPLREGEDVVAKMPGGHYWQDSRASFATWRPGAIYLTTHRLIAFRKDPHEVLWQSTLLQIAGVRLEQETSVGGEKRERLLVETLDGSTTLLSAERPQRLIDLIRRARRDSGELTPAPRAEDGTAQDNAAEPVTEVLSGEMWYQEQRSGSSMWRGGTGAYDTRKGFSWKGALDQRPAIRLLPEDIQTVTAESGRTPLGNSSILVVESATASYRLASSQVEQWAVLLHQVSQQEQVGHDSES